MKQFGYKFSGGFFLLMVILIWVASAVLIRLVFTNPDFDFDKPMFLTYYSTNWFMIYLVPAVYKYAVLRRRAMQHHQGAAQTW